MNPISPLPLLFAIYILFFCESMLRQGYWYNWVKFSIYQLERIAVRSVRLGVTDCKQDSLLTNASLELDTANF